jgi:hypothetical protein
MKKTGSHSLSALIRLALAAEPGALGFRHQTLNAGVADARSSRIHNTPIEK